MAGIVSPERFEGILVKSEGELRPGLTFGRDAPRGHGPASPGPGPAYTLATLLVTVMGRPSRFGILEALLPAKRNQLGDG